MRKGQKMSEEAKQKIRVANTGKVLSPETRKKISESKKTPFADENCKGQLEVHHILPWRDYVELRFNINNGITLCHSHHPRKKSEEIRLSPYFQELVASLDQN